LVQRKVIDLSAYHHAGKAYFYSLKQTVVFIQSICVFFNSSALQILVKKETAKMVLKCPQ